MHVDAGCFAVVAVHAERFVDQQHIRRFAHTLVEQEIQELVNEYCAEPLNTGKFSGDAASAKQSVFDSWTERCAEKPGRFMLYCSVGCGQCAKGYKGRVGLHELVSGSDKVKRPLQKFARAWRGCRRRHSRTAG